MTAKALAQQVVDYLQSLDNPTQEQLTEAAALIAEAEAIERRNAEDREQHPLKYGRLWANEEAEAAPGERTSQRGAFSYQPEGPLDTLLVTGGNGVGKTEAAAQLAVAAMLGNKHPDTVAWCQANGIDPKRLPDGPGRVLLLSRTHGASLKYNRPKLDKYLPKGVQRVRWTANQEAMVCLKGHRSGEVGQIHLGAYEQGAEQFESGWWHLVIFDEEPPEAVYDQLASRTHRPDNKLHQKDGRNVGLLVLVLTPEHGLTWIDSRLIRGDEPGVHWQRLSALDCPYTDKEALLRVSSAWPDHKKKSKIEGLPAGAQGRIWPNFDKNVGGLHVVEPFPIPRSWPKWLVVDWGTRNPAALLWFAEGPDDRHYIYRQIYTPGHTSLELGLMALEAMGWQAPKGGEDARRRGRNWRKVTTTEAIAEMWGDSEDPGAIRTWKEEHGLNIKGVPKPPGSVKDSIDLVAERLTPEADGKPSLMVFSTCPDVIREMGLYRWKKQPRTGEREGKEEPVKKDDHCCDAVRYYCYLRKRTVSDVSIAPTGGGSQMGGGAGVFGAFFGGR